MDVEHLWFGSPLSNNKHRLTPTSTGPPTVARSLSSASCGSRNTSWQPPPPSAAAAHLSMLDLRGGTGSGCGPTWSDQQRHAATAEPPQPPAPSRRGRMQSGPSSLPDDPASLDRLRMVDPDRTVGGCRRPGSACYPQRPDEDPMTPAGVGDSEELSGVRASNTFNAGLEFIDLSEINDTSTTPSI